MFLLNLISTIIIAYFVWAVVYQFIFAAASKFRSQKEVSNFDTKNKKSFAVLIPAYKEDKVILETAKDALKQDYPSDLYDVFVIADQLQPETLAELLNMPIHLVEVKFKKSTKAKALREALAQIEEQAYDATVVLDVDNIMKRDFLNQMNMNFQNGHRIVQGCRAAKNEDTAMAILDGASEAANNNILCEGHNALGLSGRLAGSGMAFDLELFREVMQETDAISGFDKELELRLTQKGEFVFYNKNAIVFDEKVRNTQNFTRQRGRWLAAQYQHCSNFFFVAITSLLKEGNYDFFNKVMQMTLPPRLILPVVLGMMMVLNFVFAMNPILWATLLVLNISTYFLALPFTFWKRKNLEAFAFLPKALLATFRSLLLISEAKKRFLHTTHGV